jgi:hypothetical protein
MIFVIVIINCYGQSNYDNSLKTINKTRVSLLQNNVSEDSIKRYLLHTFENTIFPYWIGTTWDYNGYTNVPNKGEIACGYFVSTTLKHLGFNWNRYELAKMYSKQIVEDICDSVYTFYTKDELHTYVRYRPDNLYIIGLSGHVGLVLKYKGSIWFIHSDYYNVKGPVKEKFERAIALNDSDVFWCGTFLTHSTIQKWLHKTAYHLKRKTN